MLGRPYRGNLPAGFPVCSKIMQDVRGDVSCEDGGRYDKMLFVSPILNLQNRTEMHGSGGFLDAIDVWFDLYSGNRT